MHNIPDFLRITPEMQEHFANGGMIKRADGSYSRRGLWDNIRANKGSGRKPTKEMLEQEAKIRSQEQYGGPVEEFGNGGYTVKRSTARKGKTHVVIGPDGTKKYFGDSKLGQHPSDPARKKAFYARHKHNLANNPYFRAFARATWKDGGEIPMYASGTAAVDPAQLNQDQLTNWNRFQYYASKNANITDPAYNTDRQKGYDLLNQYNQANPNNQITADSIPTYQAYFQKLQAGQTNVGQAGQQYVQKNFTQGVSPTDAFIGTQTLGSRVPMRGKKTVTNANTGQVVYNSGPRTSTAIPTPVPSQPVAQTNIPVPGMQTATLAYGGFYDRRTAAKMQRWRSPIAADTAATTFANGGLTKYQNGDTVDYAAELAKWKQEHGQPTYSNVAFPNNVPGGQMVFNVPAGTTFGRTQSEPVVAVPEQTIPLQQPAANLEEIELAPTRGMSISDDRITSIPRSLIRKVPTVPSYLETTYDQSTKEIPKTVMQFFDTESYANNRGPVTTKIIFDKATNKGYKREYDDKTGKFKIVGYSIASNDPVTQAALLRDVGAHVGNYADSDAMYNVAGDNNNPVRDDSMCAWGRCGLNRKGELQYFPNSQDYTTIDNNNDSDKGKFSSNFMTIDSSKSFDENINMMKQTNRKIYDAQNVQNRVNEEDYETVKKQISTQLNRSLTKEEENQLRAEIIKRQQQVPYNENLVRMPSHEETQYYIPQAQDETKLNYKNEVNKESSPILDYYGRPNSLPFYDKALNAFDEMIGSNIWREDDSSKTPEGKPNVCLDCFKPDFDNPIVMDDAIRLINEGWSTGFHDKEYKQKFEDYVARKNKKLKEKGYDEEIVVRYNSTPNPQSPANKTYRNGGRTLGIYQNGNQVQLNQQQPGMTNLGQMGPGSQGNLSAPFATNIPAQNAGMSNVGTLGPSSSQNTVNIAQQTPGVTNLGTFGPSQSGSQPANSTQPMATVAPRNPSSFVNNQNPAGLSSIMNSRIGLAQGLKQNANQFNNKGTASTTATKPTVAQSVAQLNNGLNGTPLASGDTTAIDQGLSDYFNSDTHRKLQDIDAAETGIGNILKIGTSINKNSQNAAVLGFDKAMNSRSTNTMTITPNRKGIEYAKYGGEMGLKEGQELDLTTEQIHKLEKLGYKFQIL